MRKLATLTAAAALTIAAGAQAAHDQLPLHAGSAGPKVAAIQWLLGGHRPNVFTNVKGTYAKKPTGYFGAYTATAIVAYKYRIGYPTKWVKPVAGAYFFALLEGQKIRPASWVLNAANRVKAIVPGATKTALAVKAYEISQLGVSEQPPGCNCGPQVRLYQSSTGAYNAAWCVSFQQYSFGHVGYGHFADDTASVYYAVDYAAARQWLNAKPKVGALVAFIEYDHNGQRIPGTGHMGFVSKVTATGYSYISGNSSNRVEENYYTLGDRSAVFIYLPNVA